MYLDLAGGNRIPKISERKARTVAELREAGVGVDRVLLTHDGTTASSDLFQSVLTMLDDKVALGILPLVPPDEPTGNGQAVLNQDQEKARQLGRDVHLESAADPSGWAIVKLAHEGDYDLIIMALSHEVGHGPATLMDDRLQHVLRHAHCRVFLAATPAIPQEVVDKGPSSR
jgi:nucleotide-binding universal stress UspA family protein